MAHLAIENLHKVYAGGRHALRGVSFELQPGVFGLLGPNGAGKTTLMESLALEREPESGRIRFGALDAWRSPTQWRELLGLMPQHFGFVPHLSARETLQLAAGLSALPHRALRARIEYLLEKTRLTWAATRRVEGFSRGMKQRLAIAWSLLADPAIWLLDEPTSGLDPEERIAFRELLAEEGPRRITILSTHIVEDVERCCSRVGVLVKGELRFIGPPEELLRKAEGRVWEFPVAPEQVDAWSQRSDVVAIRALATSPRVRAVGESAPVSGAGNVSPTLEDAYLDLLRTLTASRTEFLPVTSAAGTTPLLLAGEEAR